MIDGLYVPEAYLPYVRTLDDIELDEDNPNQMTDAELAGVWKSLQVLGWIKPITMAAGEQMGDGHQRIRACLEHGVKHGPVVVLEQIDDPGKRMLLMEAANTIRGTNDPQLEAARFQAILDAGRSTDLMAMIAMEQKEFDKRLQLLRSPEGGIDLETAQGLMAKDITQDIPAFTVLDGRSGVWQQRTVDWRKIIPPGWCVATRAELLTNTKGMIANAPSVSVFNPTLAEFLIRGYSAPGDNILIPFMGEPVISGVSLVLERNIYGIELREEQADINADFFTSMKIPEDKWCIKIGDACEESNYPGGAWAHQVISCPPYLWLEKYSDLPEDLSNQDEIRFWKSLTFALDASYNASHNGCFLTLIVGNIRRKDGSIVDMMGNTMMCAIEAGWHPYNDAVYLQPTGSAGSRVGLFTKTRKLVRTHEYVLVFYKGDVSKAKDRALIMNESIRVGTDE